MQRVLRHEDGSMLAESEWKAIRQSALIVVRTNLYGLNTTAPQAAGRPRKKKYYKLFFMNEWVQALRQLEGLAPLVSLCSGEWKVDMTFGNVLQDEPSRPVPQVPSHSVPPSRSSTPSSVGPASRVGPAFCSGSPFSHVSPASRAGPVSSHVTSHTAPASSVSTSSSVSHSRLPSPHCVALKSSQRVPKPVQPPPESALASKSVGPKGKRRHNPSPTP
jgi:hypothetical protein